MTQKLWFSYLTAFLTLATGSFSASYAASTPPVTQEPSSHNFLQPLSLETSPLSTPDLQIAQSSPQAQFPSGTSITKIYPHMMAGRRAATLYVQNIPVLTFLGDSLLSDNNVGSSKGGSKLRSAGNAENDDPVERASTIAAQLEQLQQDQIDAGNITVVPEGSDRFLIQVNGQELVAIDADTILPDTTTNAANDALQATNRLRRLMGNAEPLGQIPGMPVQVASLPTSTQTYLEPVLYRITGYASWYGPGFDGNMSASGEIFNQYDMTAAHPSLPFGTRVKVTNLDNGLSIIVRINDRGPFVGDRILDVSAGAAEKLGMIQSGVAPVTVEVLGQ